MQKLLTISFLLLLSGLALYPQADTTFRFDAPDNGIIHELLKESPHRLTIFLLPSKVKYDWNSPRTLYKSLKKNFIKNIFKKDSYLLGHAFLELRTPLSDSVILTGMRVVTRAEEKQYLLKDQYGLSILGTDLNGRLESNSELEEKIVKYSRTGQMTFMTLLINEDAAKRMLEFFTVFSSDEEDQGSPKNHYGGAFYPRYYGEGAGCSAFVISFLELGALFEEEYDGWRIELDLPRDLMGGPYNEGNEVRLKDIRNRDHWADEGDSKTTYEPFEIYDPTLISEWITEIFMDPKLQDEYQAWPVELNKAKGILIDGRHVPAPVEESIFIEREKPSVFIR